VTAYFDYAATTPIAPEVRAAMAPYLDGQYGNPSSFHTLGQAARAAVDRARDQVAALLGCRSSEVVFTAGGTEADNLALFGVALVAPSDRRHIITSAIEHHAVLEACHALERVGCEVTYLPVTAGGMVEADTLRAALTDRTCLVSVMHANNEIGTLQPIADLALLCRTRGALFHTDAVQSAGGASVRVADLGVDLLSLSAHKIYGPKGVGALYVREGVRLRPLVEGGGQERGRRSGTENVWGIAGFGRSAEMAREHALDTAGVLALRERLVDGVLAGIPDCRLNGDRQRRLVGNANFTFPGADGESLILALDREGFAVSAGAACTTGQVEPSHVLRALGVPGHEATCSLRITLGRPTTAAEVDALLDALPPAVARIRARG